MKSILVSALLAVVPIWHLAGAAQAPQTAPPAGVVSDSRPTRIVSPSVVATAMIRTLDGKSSLNLMVLWRGAVGWYLKEGPRTSGGRTTDGSISSSIQYGGATLQVDFDRLSHAVKIQGVAVPLEPANANVVLVDHVDGPDLKVVSTLHVDPTMAADKNIATLLKQSVQIVNFLQCDQKMTNAMAQLAADQTCKAVISK